MYLLAIISCSEDEVPELQDNRSFITDEAVEFFMNRNGSVDLTVTGNYNDDWNFGDISHRGFVYGKTTQPIVGIDNTETALGAIPVYATFREIKFLIIHLPKPEYWFSAI